MPSRKVRYSSSSTLLGLVACLIGMTVGCDAPKVPAAPGDDAFGSVLQSACGDTVNVTVSRGSYVSGPLKGVGAQFPHHVYTDPAWTEAQLSGDLAPKLNTLQPQHVRIFFDPDSYTDPDLMTSFKKVVKLAQDAGAHVNVTWWHIPFTQADMERFADTLRDLILDTDGPADGIPALTAIKYVTIQNEPNTNSASYSLAMWRKAYRHFHDRLVVNGSGLRGSPRRLFLVGGDLVRPTTPSPGVYGSTCSDAYLPGGSLYDPAKWDDDTNKDQDWINCLASYESDIIDYYSMHNYGKYYNFGSANGAASDPLDRLTEFKGYVDALPVAQQRPRMITEFGVRGYEYQVGAPACTSSYDLIGNPGYYQNCCTDSGPIPGSGTSGCENIGNTRTSAYIDGWYYLEAARRGYVAVVKWTAFYRTGSSWERWPFLRQWNSTNGVTERPAYHVQRMFTHTVPRDWRAASTSGSTAGVRVQAFNNGTDDTVLVLNKSGCAMDVKVAGLPANKSFYVIVWNFGDSGGLCALPQVTSSSTGVIGTSLSSPRLIAFTSRYPALGLSACQ